MKRGMAMLSEDRERFRRFARPREVAFAAMFLASEAAAMITGTNLVIDGEGAIR
jgi:NAD(P)-dependent dehydrogenase (short-subunit alcohol dehydrogenase family)